MSTNGRKPTDQQAILIKLATRKQGVTRPEVRDALGYDAGSNIPVQTMLKTLAARFGFELVTPEEVPSEKPGRWLTVYGFKPIHAAAVNVRRAPRKVAARKVA
jgi:hypothetical protein